MQDDNKADFPPPSELAPVPQEAIGVLIARWERKARDEEWNAAIDEAARLCSYFGIPVGELFEHLASDKEQASKP